MDIFPEEGRCGAFSMLMHRGTKASKNHEEFTSDPGDYGRGEYWTNIFESAESYGLTESKIITMDGVYHIPASELTKLIMEYGTCNIESGPAARLDGATALTKHFVDQGYKAVLTTNYESFGEIAICIFPLNATKEE